MLFGDLLAWVSAQCKLGPRARIKGFRPFFIEMILKKEEKIPLAAPSRVHGTWLRLFIGCPPSSRSKRRNINLLAFHAEETALGTVASLKKAFLTGSSR